jgi:hypothetical protein
MRTARGSLAILLCAAALAGAAAGALAAHFPDVPKWHWAWPHVQGLCDAGIATGYQDGLYGPDQRITRDQMAVFIARASGWVHLDDDMTASPPLFSDVPAGFWAGAAIQACLDNNIVQGYADGAYRPRGAVTRDQMAVFIARAKGWVFLQDDMTASPALFPDVPAGFWAGTAVQACLYHGVLQGYPDGFYRPRALLTRGQMAVFICRAFDLPIPPQPHHITQHFPLALGDRWTHRLSADAASADSSVVGLTDLDGQAFSRIAHSLLLAARSRTGFTYWRAAPDGLRLGALDSPELGYLTTEPLLCIPNGLHPGDQGAQTVTVYRSGYPQGEGTFTYRFAGLEEVDVPAGAFPDCMKLELSGEGPGLGVLNATVWLAPNVGLIKVDTRPSGGAYWAQLTQADVGGVTYP